MIRIIRYMLLSAVLAAGATNQVRGDTRDIKADYPLTRLSDRVHVIVGPIEEPNKANQGYRNNIVIVLTSEGVVIMDPGTSVYVGRMVLKKLRQLTEKPVVAVFNSHVHGDHWLGNQAFLEANPAVRIYSHPRTIELIKTGAGKDWVDRMNRSTDNGIVGTKPVAPNTPVKDGQTVAVGDVSFRVHLTGPGHSDSDIMIEILGEKIVFTGDNVRVDTVALNIASFKGNVAAMDRILGLDASVYIPGHGKTGDRKIVESYKRFLSTLRATVAKHYESGMADYDMKPIVIKALADYKDWVRFEEHIGRLVSLAYLEVQDEAFN